MSHMSSSTKSHHKQKQRPNSRLSHRSTKLTHRVTSTQTKHSEINTQRLKRSYEFFNSFSITNRDRALVHLTVNIAPIQQTFRVPHHSSTQSTTKTGIEISSIITRFIQWSSIRVHQLNKHSIVSQLTNYESHMNMSSSTHSLRAHFNHHTDSFSDIT